MVSVEVLWRPILLSTVFVFLASNLMWMALAEVNSCVDVR